jgi:hypothetical protein
MSPCFKSASRGAYLYKFQIFILIGPTLFQDTWPDYQSCARDFSRLRDFFLKLTAVPTFPDYHLRFPQPIEYVSIKNNLCGSVEERLMAKKRVYYSFYYNEDASRVQQNRQHGYC